MQVLIHELRVQIHELRVQIHELRVQIHELRVQIHELWDKIHELRVQIHVLRVQIPELRVQIKLFGNSWSNFHIFKKNLCSAFKLPLPGTVGSSTLYQQWHIREWLLISAPCLYLVPFLIFSPIKQLYSKVDNSRMYRYGNAVFTLNLY